MQTYDSIKSKLNEIFCDVFDSNEIQIFDEMTAQDLEEWDSLNHITLILAIESEFKIKLRAAEVGGLSNVGEMITLLQNRV